MFEYFKDYSWNLALSMALDAGANMDEVDRASRDLRGIADGVAHANDFFHAWEGGARKLCLAAAADERAGHALSAAEKYRRACVMFITAERIPRHDYPPRLAAYDELLHSFEKSVKCSGARCEKVGVPYMGSVIPALFVPAPGDGQAPCIVHFNGLDGVKEYLYFSGIADALNKRGVSTLIADNPGVGEALRKYGLRNAPEAELPAGACLDYLETRADVDQDRIGMMALSLGGYHAPRATALEPRFKCCVVWGANYDWGARFKRRLAGGNGAQNSVPHYVEHVQWVLGKNSPEEALRTAERFTLEGVLDRIRVPIFINHGEGDRQIPVEEARRTYEACVNSPRRQLRIFTAEEGGEQHCNIGNMSLATNEMADWVAEVLGAVGRS